MSSLINAGGDARPSGQVSFVVRGRDGVERTPTGHNWRFYPLRTAWWHLRHPIVSLRLSRAVTVPVVLAVGELARAGRTVRTLAVVREALPAPGLPREVNAWRTRNLPRFLRGYWKFALAVLVAHVTRLPVCCGQLRLAVNLADGRRLEYGLASLRLVTTAGVNAIVDAFQNTVEVENFKFHGFGTGGTAEAVGDTALVTELTTQYATDNTRPTGSQTENGANVYRTVATLDPDSAVAITEHGIFTQAATGGGTLLDRSLFSVINVGATGDTLDATYDFTVTSGG